MKIQKVDNKQSEKEFLLLPVRLYKNEKHWIRPLDKDMDAIFNQDKNKFFRHGELERWILVNDKGETIGRVAAFINRKTMKATEYVTGGMGFFECIDDQAAAFMLFDTCSKWLEERGIEAMDGPINFGERDKWWGLLIGGFDQDPNYGMPYHFPYYRKFFEAYGFHLYFEQYTFHRKVEMPLPELYADKSDRIARDPKYRFESISLKNLEKYAEDFRAIYNKAWVKHTGVGEMKKDQARLIMKQLKPVLDEDLIWFSYYDNEPIAFFIMIPELNQIFRYVDGKLDWIGKLKFLYYRWRGVCKSMFGVAFGVVPEFQGRGVEGAIVVAAGKRIQPMAKYTDFEMNWIGDFNPKMIHICEQVGSTVIKTHATFRKIFDPTKPFIKHPIIH